MKKRLWIIFLVVVTVPLLAVAWLGYSAYLRERETTAERYAILARRQLAEVDRLVESYLDDLEGSLRGFLSTSGAEAMRALTRRTGIIRRFFVIDTDGAFLFPPEESEKSADERDFLARMNELELASQLTGVGPDSSREAAAEGWYTWFMGDGLNFIFWQRASGGAIRGIELERIAFISGIVAMLPGSDPAEAGELESRIVLTDARGAKLYQWGLYAPAEDLPPLVEISLSPPLEAWHLAFHLDLESGGDIGSAGYLPVAAGILALIIVVAFLAVYFYRESTRVVRESLQKVSFVNQVSHELKSPLTNIRLYAELLDRRLEGERERAELGIIIAESSRLGRMINNVLSFARSERSAIEVNHSEAAMDEIVARVVEAFAPALAERRIAIAIDSAAPEAITTDPDLVEQIVSNLVSNVEKYAASGGYLGIETRREAEVTSVTVRDRGPGIPVKERNRIFEPFYRMSNTLTDGVTGAGIGLTISRRLAELLGGRLILVEGGKGATFRLELPNRPKPERP